MGRPSLGQAGRTVTAATKISKIEEAALVARHGTVHAAMRHALEHLDDRELDDLSKKGVIRGLDAEDA